MSESVLTLSRTDSQCVSTTPAQVTGRGCGMETIHVSRPTIRIQIPPSPVPDAVGHVKRRAGPVPPGARIPKEPGARIQLSRPGIPGRIFHGRPAT